MGALHERMLHQQRPPAFEVHATGSSMASATAWQVRLQLTG